MMQSSEERQRSDLPDAPATGPLSSTDISVKSLRTMRVSSESELFLRSTGILVLPRRGRGSSVSATLTATRAREVRIAGSVLLGDRFFEGPFIANSSGQAQSLARDHDEAGEGPER
jgi:hypothetical protein